MAMCETTRSGDSPGRVFFVPVLLILAGSLRRRWGMSTSTIFLLSPAHCGGKRARILLRADADFDLAIRFRAGEASLGEVFSFLSGLYFRGKLAYSARFGDAPALLPPALVITTGRGLLGPDTRVGPADLRSFADVPIDPRNDRYATPLTADAKRLAMSLPADSRVVLLGSIATSKYVEILLAEFGDRLHFPDRFVGVGDMQRGSLMLRAAAAGEELSYVRADGAVRSLAARRRAG
jgi:hypothetical protein